MAKIILHQTPEKGDTVAIAANKTAVWAGDRYIPSKTGRIVALSESHIGEKWIRPMEWLPMPPMEDWDERVDLLVFVAPLGINYLGFSFDCPYTVDWGDGSVMNYQANETAERTYSYADIDLAGDTLTREGYKQVIVSAYPQPGNNVTAIDFSPATAPSQMGQIFEAQIAGPHLTALDVENGQYVFRDTRAFSLYRNSIVDATRLLYGFRRLRKVTVLYLRQATMVNEVFAGCIDLSELPEMFELGEITTAASMFSSCESLRSIPIFSTASLQNAERMFSGCGLEIPPAFDFSNVTNLSYCFAGCKNLKTVSPIAWGTGDLVTKVENCFGDCSALTELGSFPLWKTGNISTMPILQYCHSLAVLHIEATGGGRNSLGFRQTGTGLRKLSISDASELNEYVGSDTLINAYGLEEISLPGAKCNLRFSNTCLSAEALNSLFNDLADVTAWPRSITITGAPGAATCDRSIATAKGWTVIG